MGLKDLLFGVSDELSSEERLLSSLERIASALETLARVQRPVSEGFEDTSTVLYTNDEEDFEREVRREAYEARTGRKLASEEDVPRPAGASWPSKREREAPFPPADQLWIAPEGDSAIPEGFGDGKDKER